MALWVRDREAAVLADTNDPHAVGLSSDAMEFVRFCYARRPVPWPELYDEMSAVAARGLFRGWGYPELADHGIALTLSGMPVLAALVRTIVRDGGVAGSGRGARGTFAFGEAVAAR